MAYTWTNKTKTGGVGLTGKIVQKGKDDFPLMYANDLDWANVEVESGVNLNTTDDLLDYIKGGNGTINGRIDELELSNAGYEIRCDKSVCYVGDIVGQGYQNQKLPVSIYKNGTLLSWTNAYTEGITFDSNNFTKPSGGNDLIHWSTSDCYLQGEANKIGTYVFNFKKGDVNIASFMLTVLMKPLESYHTTIYISSQTKPTTPTGGSYNFSTKAFTAPSGGWSTSITGLTGTIWFSSGTVFSDSNTSPVWSEPCMYITSETVLKDDEHRVREVAVYKVACGPYTYGNTQYQETVPPKPTTQNLYTFNADSTLDSFTPPSGWHKEPEAAIAAYKNSLTDSAEDQIKKQNYRIWKTYNSYSITVTDGVLVTSTYAESGWSQPVRYLNIDKILEDARTQSEQIAQTALQNAYNDLDLAEDLETVVDAINAVFAWRIVGDASNNNPLSNISDKYVELVDDADTSSAQHQLFTRFSGYRKQNGNYEGILEMMNDTTNLCVSGYQMKALKFDSIYYDGQEYLNKWVAFIPTTTEIRTQISDLNEDLGELSTAVNAMNPHEIRLQVSKGFKKDVTWTEVDVTEWESARTVIDGHSDDEEYDVNYGDTIRHSQKLDGQGNWSYMQVPSITDDCISALPTEKYDPQHVGGWHYGHYYRVHYGSWSIGAENAGYKYFRCDYPVSTGFLNVLADRVSLGIAKKTTGQEKGADLTFSFKNQTTNATITADNIVLNGDTIADAIFGKSLNINNTTYLCSDGDVYMGVPNGQNINPDAADKSALNTGSGSSRFNHDGSGQLCGGNISWNNNGVLCVKQANIGEATANWYIKTLGLSDSIVNNSSQSELYGTPVIYGRDTSTNDELFITPQYMFSCNSAHETDRNYDYWRIQRDGSARFAKGNIAFNNDGSATLGNASGAHIEMSSAGAVSLHGIDVNISSSNSTTIASGIIGSAEATSILLNGTNNTIGITGKLNTQDLSVGNGSCFFKGTSTALSPATLHGHNYGSGTAGAGHLANGNIWWDNSGNAAFAGDITAESMKINAVKSYTKAEFDANETSGKMWFTNYGSAKAIAQGVIQNASVTLEDSDPVILFKSVRNGETSFFVLNPLLLGNGSDTVTTPLFTNLGNGTGSSIDQLIDLRLASRWKDGLHIDSVSETSDGVTSVEFEKNDSGRYLYAARIVEANCLVMTDSSQNMGIHIPYNGSQTYIYDKVIELTRFEITQYGEEIEYRKIFIYPAYSCAYQSGTNWSVTRDQTNGKLGYYISTSIGTTDSSFSNGITVVNVETGNQITTPDDKKYLVCNSNSSGLMQNTSVDFDSYLGNSAIQGTIDASNYQQYSNTSIDNYSSGLNSYS